MMNLIGQLLFSTAIVVMGLAVSYLHKSVVSLQSENRKLWCLMYRFEDRLAAKETQEAK